MLHTGMSHDFYKKNLWAVGELHSGSAISLGRFRKRLLSYGGLMWRGSGYPQIFNVF